MKDKEIFKIYIMQAIRPIGILIFIEAIAWFLLRQYRTLIEDYKSFHKMYLKRSNYLISYLILRKQDSAGSELPLVMSLLEEDLSNKLGAEETTEAIEIAKQPDTNPVFSLLSTVTKTLQNRVKK